MVDKSSREDRVRLLVWHSGTLRKHAQSLGRGRVCRGLGPLRRYADYRPSSMYPGRGLVNGQLWPLFDNGGVVGIWR